MMYAVLGLKSDKNEAKSEKSETKSEKKDKKKKKSKDDELDLHDIKTPDPKKMEVLKYKKEKYYHHMKTDHVYEMLDNEDENGNQCVGDIFGHYKKKDNTRGFIIKSIVANDE